MVWFKVDDKHHDHRKTRRALKGAKKRRDAAAIGLWCLAGSWSADNLMDGFVPTDELLRWDDDAEALAERLVDAELWEPSELDGEPGFQFVNWDEHQPTKTEVEAKRAAARERMRSVRAKGGRGSGEVRANEQENSARSSRSVRSTPSRPDPTRPVPLKNREAKASLSDKSDDLERFDEFWDAYAKKVDRAAAEKKWALALKKPGVTADLLIEAASEYVAYESTNEGGRFVMGPAKWLLNERWKDERANRRATQPQTNVQAHMALVRQLGEEEPLPLPQIGSGR